PNMGQCRDPLYSTWQELIAALHPGRSGNEPAVHKPLFTLMLLARAQRGGSNRVPFKDVDAALEEAIHLFGSARAPGGSELPFWHLKNDGFWVFEDEDSIPRRKAGDRPTKTILRKHDARGHVPRHLWRE